MQDFFTQHKITWLVRIPLCQLCPTRAPHAAQSKVLCGPVQVAAVVKVSYILTTCPYLDNFDFDILMQVVFSANFITSVTTAVRIRTLAVH